MSSGLFHPSRQPVPRQHSAVTPPALPPDPVVLLASLCETSRRFTLPLIAAAHGSHPITWTPLTRHHLTPPPDAWAIGVIGGGTTTDGKDVVVAFVVDTHDRQRAVVWRDGAVIDTAHPNGLLVADCRAALGLVPGPNRG